jgi:hypothetical protein
MKDWHVIPCTLSRPFVMHRLTTDLVNQACRIFLSQAYPGDDSAVPPRKRLLLELCPGQEMLPYLEATAGLKETCQVVCVKNNSPRALLIRLGCTHYPHLKLKAQLVDHEGGSEWLFNVETHDGFSATNFLPPPDHPDAAAWAQMQHANAALKQRIEAAWEQAGLTTFNALLRRDLQTDRPAPI